MQKHTFGQHLTLQSAGVTLKIRSWLPKSNQLFPLSQLCTYASLVKIHDRVLKRSYADADADGIHTKTNLSLHHRLQGHIEMEGDANGIRTKTNLSPTFG